VSAEAPALVFEASAVALGRRGMLIEGRPGSGKSSLVLALIERGGILIGDDAVSLVREDTSTGPRVICFPPPNIEGLLEVRGVGIVRLPVAPPCPVSLILTLGTGDCRLPDQAARREVLGAFIPALPFVPGEIAPAQRAAMALDIHGLAHA